MKQLVLAAFLLGTPVAALAEIRLSGEAAMGLTYEQGKTQAVSDMQITLHASRTTDGGVEFGAVLDINQSPSRALRHDPPRAYVYMATGDFTLKAGNNVGSALRHSSFKQPELGF